MPSAVHCRLSLDEAPFTVHRPRRESQALAPTSHRHRDLVGMIRWSAGIFESCHLVRCAQFVMQDCNGLCVGR